MEKLITIVFRIIERLIVPKIIIIESCIDIITIIEPNSKLIIIEQINERIIKDSTII